MHLANPNPWDYINVNERTDVTGWRAMSGSCADMVETNTIGQGEKHIVITQPENQLLRSSNIYCFFRQGPGYLFSYLTSRRTTEKIFGRTGDNTAREIT